MSYVFLRKRAVIIVAFCVVCVVVLSACGGNSPTASTHKKNSLGAGIVAANAALRHNPFGTAILSWDHATRVLFVRVSLSGLLPMSVHPAHIQEGTCRTSGKLLYPLNVIHADATGNGSSVTRINDSNGIPLTGWTIDIHNGPGLAPATQLLPISCGEITNSRASLGGTQLVRATLGTSFFPNQQASGVAQFELAYGNLSVMVSMTGLLPGSTHMVQIFSGRCTSRGRMLYVLKPVVADGQGNGTTTTLIQHVNALPDHGWHVNVHLSADTATQVGGDIIACGDVIVSR